MGALGSGTREPRGHPPHAAQHAVIPAPQPRGARRGTHRRTALAGGPRAPSGPLQRRRRSRRWLHRLGCPPAAAAAAAGERGEVQCGRRAVRRETIWHISVLELQLLLLLRLASIIVWLDIPTHQPAYPTCRPNPPTLRSCSVLAPSPRFTASTSPCLACSTWWHSSCTPGSSLRQQRGRGL